MSRASEIRSRGSSPEVWLMPGRRAQGGERARTFSEGVRRPLHTIFALDHSRNTLTMTPPVVPVRLIRFPLPLHRVSVDAARVWNFRPPLTDRALAHNRRRVEEWARDTPNLAKLVADLDATPGTSGRVYQLLWNEWTGHTLEEFSFRRAWASGGVHFQSLKAGKRSKA